MALTVTYALSPIFSAEAAIMSSSRKAAAFMGERKNCFRYRPM